LIRLGTTSSREHEKNTYRMSISNWSRKRISREYHGGDMDEIC
jgi:hypothetical protein